MFLDILYRLRALFRRNSMEAELDRELRAHLDHQVEKHIQSGLSPQEASRRARLEFGGLEQVKEEVRDSWGVRLINELMQDLSYGLRQLRRNPGFTAVAIITLALGIGANTALFTLIDAVMLKTLPVGQPDRLVILKWTARKSPKNAGTSAWGPCSAPSGAHVGCSFPYSAFQQFHSTSKVLSGVFAEMGPNQMTVNSKGTAGFAFGDLVSGDYFSTLLVPVVAGRAIEPRNDSAAASPSAVISYSYWKAKFGGDPSVVGKPLILNGVPFTIVGVAPPHFVGIQPGLPTDLWVPLATMPVLYPPWGSNYMAPGGGVWWLWVVGRLRDGVTMEQAQAALGVTFAQAVTSGPNPAFTPGDHPSIRLADASTGLGLLEFLFAKPLFLLMAGVGLVLLIACANLANLMLARASGRQREIAMRIALGAGQWRLVRQVLIESLLLSGMGGAGGLLLAFWGSRGLAAFISTGWFGPVSINVTLDQRVLAFTLAASAVTGLLFGLAPALRGNRLNVLQALKAGPGNPHATAHHKQEGFLRNSLVAWQVALAVPLLIGTGLLTRNLSRLLSVDPGFNPNHVLLFRLDPGSSGYKGKKLITLYDALLQRLDALPGVVSATLTQHGLITGGIDTADLWIEGRSSPAQSVVGVLRVGPDFLQTMRIPLLAGRSIDRRDFVTSRHIALVNQAAALRYFPDKNPLDQHFGWKKQQAGDFEIVGIVGDTKYDDLRKAAAPTVYLPMTGGFSTFEVRTSIDPKAIVSSVRSEVSRVAPEIPIADIRTQTQQIKNSLFQDRLLADLCSLLAGLALVLASVGLYGVVSYGVAQRTNEIGIRMALGAQKSDVLRLVVGQGMIPALLGWGVGILGALGLTRFLSGLLYGIKPTDPVTFIAVSFILIAVALVACYIPARRAAKVDPMVALRYE